MKIKLCTPQECKETGCSYPDCLTEEARKSVDDCSECDENGTHKSGSGPSHFGSKNCESGSLASGGNKVHCTCDICF